VTLATLTEAIGGATKDVSAFDGSVSCRGADESHWIPVSASDSVYVTARMVDVVLTTSGDGAFSHRNDDAGLTRSLIQRA